MKPASYICDNHHYSFFICLEMKTEPEDLKNRGEREKGRLNTEKKTQNCLIEKYYFYYLHIPHNIFSFYFKTMKFNKLKYHFIFPRQAEVQGFEWFGKLNSASVQFYSRKLILQS